MLTSKVYKLILLAFLAIILAIIAVKFTYSRYKAQEEKMAITNTPLVTESKKEPVPETLPSPTPPLPSDNHLPPAFLIPIPFTPQAPSGNWDLLHNEACEEASAIMTASYFNGNESERLDKNFVEQELTKIFEWEIDNFGYHLDINSEELARLMQEYYGLNAKIIDNFTEEDIKNELVQNHAVIWPANGQKLGNPNFRNSGPPYHVVVIKGYDKNGFITNDPGTRRGLNYIYTYQTLFAANGDFNHTTRKVDTNKKNAIAVWKK